MLPCPPLKETSITRSTPPWSVVASCQVPLYACVGSARILQVLPQVLPSCQSLDGVYVIEPSVSSIVTFLETEAETMKSNEDKSQRTRLARLKMRADMTVVERGEDLERRLIGKGKTYPGLCNHRAVALLHAVSLTSSRLERPNQEIDNDSHRQQNGHIHVAWHALREDLLQTDIATRS